jgi:hypothetical protein
MAGSDTEKEGEDEHAMTDSHDELDDLDADVVVEMAMVVESVDSC